ncbi:MAG: oxidoreductase [Saprospiraceae bacterium]
MEIKIKEGKKTAILFGGSGLVGRFCLDLLLESPIYIKVISFGRKKLNIDHEKLEQFVIDFDNLSEAKRLIQGNDLFCTLGTTIKKAGSQEAFRKVDFEYPKEIATIAAKNGVSQFILVSSVGADSKSKVFYSQVKGELEDAIKELPFWGIHILRPSMLLGKREERRTLEKIGIIFSKGIDFLVGDLLGKYQPVKAEDVAKAMVIEAQSLEGGIKRLTSDAMVKIGKSEKDLLE